MNSLRAVRSLKRTPAFTFAVILTLVLGLASVGSMFVIVHGVLLAPLPYGDPDELVSLSLETGSSGRISQPAALYSLYTQHSQQLSDVGFHRTGNANIWIDGDGAAPERVTATWITASMVPLLQVPPVLGRGFVADEERAGGRSAVILSEAEWRTRFAASPDIIGRTLMVNSVPREIVGVMPAGFAFPTAETRVWLPVRLPADAVVGDFFYSAVARLSAGVEPGQAQAELAQILPRLAESFPRIESGAATASWLEDMKLAPVVVPLRDEITRGFAQTLWMLAAAAGLVLLVAWANVANLMLIRADARQHELTLREALGANRLRTAAYFVDEALLLGAISGAIALLLSFGAVRMFVAFGPADLPRLAELGVGFSTVAFISLVTILGIILCAAVPALRVRRAGHSMHLRDGTRSHSAGRARQRVRATIAALQFAVALVVTVSSALLLRTAYRLHEVHPGFEARDVTTLWTQLPFARYGDAASVDFYARLKEQVAQLASVEAAGLVMQLPLAGREPLEQTFRIGDERRALSLPVNVVDDGYFSALGIPLIAGSGFGSMGQQRGSDIIISRLASATIFGDPDGASAIGRQLMLEPAGPAYNVVGVVGDVRDRDLAEAPSAMIYRPQVVPIDPVVEPGARRSMALVVKSSAPAESLVSEIRRIVHNLDPTVPIFDVQTLSSVLRESTARLSLTLTLMTVAAAITLLLGTIGLYGVMSYMVALRSREFGIRVALGAAPSQIIGLVARRGLLLATGGIAVGLGLYALAAPFLSSILYGVTASDPATLAGAILVLLATAALASWLPARRAARVDPAVTLRAE